MNKTIVYPLFSKSRLLSFIIIGLVHLFPSTVLIAIRPFPPGLPTCLQDDFRELEKIYDNTDGDNWSNNNNWFTSADMGSWYGITLTSSGCAVEKIYLSVNNLVGTLPMLTFPELKQFQGWGNGLSGTIPNFNMPKLEDFNFQDQSGGFTGPIPNFNMPLLKSLHLWGNKLSGAIPNFNMPLLKTMWLDYNQLSGEIPNFNMPLLDTMTLNSNQLSGPIPNFNMPMLKTLWLDNNQLTGSIPNFNMPVLEYLHLMNNKLSGSIPNFALPKLKDLLLHNNTISGKIPNLNLPELVEFNFANNQLTDTIPNMSLPKLKIFRVTTNKLSGPLPDFTGMPKVEYFYAPFNQLSGSIPSFSNMPNLTLISLSGNQLSGSIPDFNLLSLDSLYLRDNSLSGNIPNFAGTSLSSNKGLFYFFGNGFVFGDIKGKPWLNAGDVIYAPQDSIPILFDGTILTVNTGVPNNEQQFTWYKDGAVVAVNQSNTYVPTSAGIYKCTITHNTLTVPNNPNKNLILTSTQILVSAPIANFTWDPDPANGCSPLNVNFNALSTGGTASTYLWSFPGGTPATSTAASPTVIYNSPGSFSVSLTVGNVIGSSSISQPDIISIITVPTTIFSGVTNGFTASFVNTSVNAVSYSWDFGDGQSSTEVNPTHTYAMDGDYTVVLTSANSCGSNTASQMVTVITPPTASFTASPLSGCAPLAVQFTSTSSANATSWNWSFPGGQPATSTAQNPTVTYALDGTYSVELTVGNAAGTNTITEPGFITVGAIPVASFSAGTMGASATFTNSSVNAVSYSWDFGDGQSSTEVNPTHTYAMDGDYTVVLTSANSCGSSTASQMVTVITPPTASFTASPLSGCAPLAVQFTSTSSANATSWNWSFPGGQPATSTSQNPTVTYALDGTYSVELTVGNTAGTNTITEPGFITIGAMPTAGFSAVTSGASAAFANTSLNSVSYSWDFGDGQFSTEVNPTHNYAMDGVYTVVLTSTNSCGSSTASQMVAIITPPTASFTASPLSGCAPLAVQFTNTSSSNATSWNWSFPGGQPSTSTAQNPTVTYALDGTYSVELTVGNAAGTNTITEPGFITIGVMPTAGFSAVTSGASAAFTNTSLNAVSYSWDFGDGQSSMEVNPAHNYAMDGVYTVVLTSTNSCGSSTTLQTVTIITPPTASFSAGPLSGCAPLTVQFTNTSSSNATSWNWSFPGGQPATSTAQNPTVTYALDGTYSVELTVGNAAGTNTITESGFITIDAIPMVNFLTEVNGLDVIFTNTSGNAVSYFWDFGDGQTSNEMSPIHTYDAGGEYVVVLTATNNCGSNSTSKTVMPIAVGIHESNIVKKLSLYPNPNFGNFSVEIWGQPMESIQLELLNSLGQSLGTTSTNFQSGYVKVYSDFIKLDSGFYSLRVRAGFYSTIMKVIVQ